MGAHRQRAHAWIGGERHGDERGLPAPGALQIDAVTHGAQMCGILGECRREGGFERCGAMGVEQFQHSARERTEVHAAFGGAGE